MKGVKLSQQIRELLDDGPATAREIALELGISPRRANIGLWGLQTRHHVQITGAVLNLEYGRGQRKQLKLYTLTRRGQSIARIRHKRATGTP